MKILDFKALIIFTICITASIYSYMSQLDITVHAWAMEVFAARSIQETFGYLSRMGQDWFQIIVCIYMGIYYYRRCEYTKSRIWYMAIPTFLLAGIIGWLLKIFFGRPRPKLLETMYDFQWWELPARMHSFPSGHALTTFCLLGVVMAIYSRKIQLSLFGLACLLGFARIGIGSHYLSDVIAGGAIGYFLGKAIKNRIFKY